MVRVLRQVFVTNQPRDTGPQPHNCCSKTKKVSSHKLIYELMTNFVHRKAHAACPNLHSRSCLSHIVEKMVQFSFQKKGSIFRVVFKKKKFYSLSHTEKEVQFLRVILKNRLKSLRHVQKEGSKECSIL